MDDITRVRQHTMAVMDPTGHTSVTWDPANNDEVAVARRTYEEMTGKGYSAFRTDDAGKRGPRMQSFDPDAEQMVLVPQLKGG